MRKDKAMSQFSLVEAKFIFQGHVHILTALEPVYASAIFDKINDLVKTKNPSEQLLSKIIERLDQHLPGKVRKPNELDAIELIKYRGGVKSKHPDAGTKHKCFSCSKAFYDLNKPNPACPVCKTPVAVSNTQG